MNASKKLKFAWTAVTLFLLNLVTRAQEEKKIDVDINLDKDGGSDWYMNPVFWVIGAAIFILLLVAILRGGRSKES